MYGDSQFDNGFPQSTSNVLDTGNLNWTGVSPALYSELNNLPVVPFSGDGESFATDQTGTGQVFQDRWGSTLAINQYPDNGANFFLETPPGGTPQSFTSGISNLSDQATEFPAQGGSRFAVNPVNPDDLLIGSQTGAIYLSTNEGNQWLPTNPTAAGRSFANALAFGASDSTYSFRDTDAGFLYAGTTGGQIYVSLTGGTNWYQTTGLAGAGAIEQIVADPTQGSYDAFAVTENGVYYLKNIVFNTSTGAVTSAVWTPITGNLFSQTRPLFNNPNNQYPTLFAGGLTSIAVDWRFAVPTSNTAYASNTWTLASALAATTAHRHHADGQRRRPHASDHAVLYHHRPGGAGSHRHELGNQRLDDLARRERHDRGGARRQCTRHHQRHRPGAVRRRRRRRVPLRGRGHDLDQLPQRHRHVDPRVRLRPPRPPR